MIIVNIGLTKCTYWLITIFFVPLTYSQNIVCHFMLYRYAGTYVRGNVEVFIIIVSIMMQFFGFEI